jgi:hypothetical protein
MHSRVRSIPEVYDYPFHILSHLFVHMLGTIPKVTINANALLG